MHAFASHLRLYPEVVWTALTDADKTGAFLYGQTACSTWAPEAPIDFRRGDGIELTGHVLHVRRHERLSYLLRSGPDDPPTYVTWLIRPVQAVA